MATVNLCTGSSRALGTFFSTFARSSGLVARSSSFTCEMAISCSFVTCLLSRMARVKRLSTVSPLIWMPEAAEPRIRSIIPAMALPTSVFGPPRHAPGIGLAAAA
jgi:hypothetical protein